MVTTDTATPVMVTGATGYVAGWIVKGLLEAGVTVHAPVRDPDSAEKLKHLNAIAETAPGDIKYFKADLLDEGSYAEAMKGCSVVWHTASPFTLTIKDPQKELVEPAQLGTRNVLEEASRTPSVKRVVLTSSCAAIYGDCADVAKAPNGTLTENDWNTSSSLNHQPYSYSKTVAEKEAWKIAEAQSAWQLVVINPSLVIGPGINPHATSESFNLAKQIGDGTLRPGAPDLSCGVVDVRDLAQAHITAGYKEDAEGRHIISGCNTNVLAMADALRGKYGEYPLPTKHLPKWLLWLVGPLVNKAITRKFVSLNVGLPWRADNSKSIRALGITYRPMEQSMTDMFQQLIDHGYFSK